MVAQIVMHHAQRSNKIEPQHCRHQHYSIDSSAIDIIKSDGFEPNAIVHSIFEGETPTTMAKFLARYCRASNTFLKLSARYCTNCSGQI